MKIFVKTSVLLSVILVIILAGWTPPAQAVPPPDPPEVYLFDLNSDFYRPTGEYTGFFYTQDGFTEVLPNQIYGGANWFGWSADLSPGRDRLAIADDPLLKDLPALHRDLHCDTVPRTFSVDLASGDYTVTLHFCDTAWLHDNLEVQAQGSVVLADVDVPKGATPVIKTFTVTVSDDRLDIQFSDPVSDPDPYWIINGIEIVPVLPGSATVPLPASVLLLGSGLFGLGLLGFRRKRKA